MQAAYAISSQVRGRSFVGIVRDLVRNRLFQRRLYPLTELCCLQCPQCVQLCAGCGSGRDMVYLADRAWHCTGLDNWPGAVHRARAAAVSYNLDDKMSVQRIGIEADGSLRSLPDAGMHEQTACPEQRAAAGAASDDAAALQQKQYHLVLNVRFLVRGLAQQLRAWVAPGGFILFSTFVEHPNAPPEVWPSYSALLRRCMQHNLCTQNWPLSTVPLSTVQRNPWHGSERMC